MCASLFHIATVVHIIFISGIINRLYVSNISTLQYCRKLQLSRSFILIICFKYFTQYQITKNDKHAFGQRFSSNGNLILVCFRGQNYKYNMTLNIDMTIKGVLDAKLKSIKL